MMGILKKMGHAFFLFLVGVQEKVIYISQKKERKKSGNWDLISFPHRSSFTPFYRCVHTYFHVEFITPELVCNFAFLSQW